MTSRVVLVHGAWHGAWCWRPVLEGLERRGVPARAIDLPGHGESTAPLGGLAEDAQALRAELASSPGPAVVCGHSLGGAILSEGVDRGSDVRHLVYLAAIVPDVGESVMQAISGTPPEWRSGIGTDAEGRPTLDPERAVELLYADCDAETASWAVSMLGPEDAHVMTTPLGQAAWRHFESTYVVCRQDRILAPEVQEVLARRCTHSVRWETSHSPMLSKPDLLVDLLADLAAASPA